MKNYFIRSASRDSKRTIRHLIFALLPVIFLLSSFQVTAKKLTYIDLVPIIKANPSLTLCVATLDQREVVLMGNQDARFVGYIRSAVGIAYPIKCESPENFSEVMSTTVVKALKQNGCKASVMKTNHSSTKEKTLDDLINHQADLFILITMNWYRTDTKSMSFSKVATELIYDLTVEIYNKSGELLASHRLNEKEPGLSPAGSATTKKIQKKVVNIKYPEVMTKLFSDAEIKEALQ